MRPFNDFERQRQAQTAQATWRDAGRLLRWDAENDSYIPDDALGTCKYATGSGGERIWDTSAATPGATISLPLGTVVGFQDRYRLEVQLGDTLPEPIEFTQTENAEYGNVSVSLHVREVAQ